jgi:GntR family transcriptional regulator, transcriptional repressor for pyruvate dehydrogenase complex
MAGAGRRSGEGGGGVFEELKADLTSRSGALAAAIKERIMAGEALAGERLPPSRELAARFGVSRVTLQEALNALQREGFLTSRPGPAGGVFVSDLSAPSDLWCEHMRLHLADLDDILDVRLAIEARAAALAAQRRDRHDLAVILRAVEMLQPENWPSTIGRVHWLFHEAVASASHSPRLLEASRKARGQLFPVQRLAYQEQAVYNMDSHRAIYLRIRDKDPVAAAEAMRAEIEATRIELRTLLRA